MKKSLAVMLALIMVLCMIPTTALAAKSSNASLTVSVKGTFYNPNTDKHEYFSNLRTTTHVKVNEGENPSYPVKYYFTKQKYYGSTNSSYYGKEGYKLIVTIGGKESTDLNAWVFDRDMTNVKGDGQTFYPIYSPSGYGTYQNTLFISGGTPIQPKTGTLTINKTVTGLPNDKLPASFTFNVMQGNNVKATVTVNKNGNNGYNAGSTTLPHGTYTVVEVSATVDGYTVVTTPSNGEVTISGQPTNITFTNAYTENEPQPDKPEGPTPENTSKPFIELTGEEAVKVHCTNDKANHDDKSYGLMHDGYTVGDVQGNKENGYTCDITVKPEKYVAQYNLDISGVTHTLVDSNQTGTIKLVWDKDNQKWKLATPSDVSVVFNVKCDNTQPPLDKTITIEVSKIWEDDIPGAQSITVGLYANGTKVDKKDITPNEGIWYHNFGPRPLEDNNGRDISYTIVEEPIDGYTPHYYTSGEHDKRLVFRVKNVPTEKTGAIKVSKELSGEGAEKDKEFAFTVTLLEYLDSNEVLDGGEPGYYPLSGIYTFGGFEFRDGKVTFGLKGGESVTISGIPAEYDYTVTESNNAGYTVTSENDKGTIRAKGTAEVKFTNTKSAAPTVSPTPTPTPGGGNGGGGHWHPTTTPVPVIVIPPKTGDMTIWQSILHFLGIR